MIALIIQCDFDGTITSNNLGTLLKEQFACEKWRRIELDYLRGRVSVEQSNRLQYALIEEPRERLQKFVSQHINVRPGFREFVRYCRDNAIKFVIVSSGLDFYIETVLVEIGMPDLELHCGRTVFTKDGIGISYTDPEGNTIDKGFKDKHLFWLKRSARNLIYIGDGLSDLEAARCADHVFATGHLSILLRAESVAWSCFIDFNDLLSQMKLPH